MARMRVGLVMGLFVVACGARTGLSLQDAGPHDAAPCPVSAQPWLVFDLFRPTHEPFAGIYALRADGTEGHAVVLPDARVLYPAFTRDGASMLYVAFNDMGSSLIVLDLATGARRVLATGAEIATSAVSPDGHAVAYTAHLDIRVVDWDGTNDRVLVAGPFDAGCCSWGYGHPRFTADSRTVVFATAGRTESIGLDGGGRRLLLSEDFVMLLFPNVAFSPDGSRVAISAACGGELALRIYPFASLPAPCASGMRLTTVTEAFAGNQSSNPAWTRGGSPAGLISYAADNDVFVIDAAGGVPRNLTATLTTGGSGSANDAVWAPACAMLP